MRIQSLAHRLNLHSYFTVLHVYRERIFEIKIKKYFVVSGDGDDRIEHPVDARRVRERRRS